MLLFLCGDVMTGRGIDQILPFPSSPEIYEDYIRDAREYVTLAETTHGSIPRSVPFTYIWGDALKVFDTMKPDFRIVNLETSITVSSEFESWKGINYRMNPANIDCLQAVGIHCCTLANNHVLDWGYPGLYETLETLDSSGILHAGAGRNSSDAESPALLTFSNEQRVCVFSFGMPSSGIIRSQAAGHNSPGVNYLPDFSRDSCNKIGNLINRFRKNGDIVVVSIHWGDNWGYAITEEQQQFAHALVHNYGISVLHGHSSHHVKALERYENALIIYGCGDFINDYEGIQGYEEYRSDLSLMYFVSINYSGDIIQCEMVPLQVRNFKLNFTSESNLIWLKNRIESSSRIKPEIWINENSHLVV